jgi:hypothetical protein
MTWDKQIWSSMEFVEMFHIDYACPSLISSLRSGDRIEKVTPEKG